MNSKIVTLLVFVMTAGFTIGRPNNQGYESPNPDMTPDPYGNGDDYYYYYYYYYDDDEYTDDYYGCDYYNEDYEYYDSYYDDQHPGDLGPIDYGSTLEPGQTHPPMGGGDKDPYAGAAPVANFN